MHPNVQRSPRHPVAPSPPRRPVTAPDSPGRSRGAEGKSYATARGGGAARERVAAPDLQRLIL